MGLDIYGVSRIQRVDVDEDTWEVDGHTVWTVWDAGFPGQLGPLVESERYIGEERASAHFSHGGYDRYRDMICRAALGMSWVAFSKRFDEYQDHDLFRLLHFSDCEGVTAAQWCAPIADALEQITLDDEWYQQQHRKVIACYRAGADQGMVTFR